MTWSYIEITVGVMVACLPGARLFIARYVSALRTTGSKVSKSLSRSGHVVHPSRGDGTDEGNAQSREELRSDPSIAFPAKCARPQSSQSAREEDGESQVELVIMSMDGDSKDEHECNYAKV